MRKNFRFCFLLSLIFLIPQITLAISPGAGQAQMQQNMQQMQQNKAQMKMYQQQTPRQYYPRQYPHKQYPKKQRHMHKKYYYNVR